MTRRWTTWSANFARSLVQRLALGMDFPPEFLLGMTDANHWTARQVVYDMWRSYGTPVAERFADDLNDAYLRPALEESGVRGRGERGDRLRRQSRWLSRPTAPRTRIKALDRAAIGWEGYRELKGISEDMAPTDGGAAASDLHEAAHCRSSLDGGEMLIPQRGPVAQQNGNAPEDGPPTPTGGREGSRQEARTASILGAPQSALSCAAANWRV